MAVEIDDATTSALSDDALGSSKSSKVYYHLEVDGVDARWGVRSVQLKEQLGGLYECLVQAACDPAPTARELLDAQVHLHIERGASSRTIHGIVRHARVDTGLEGPSAGLVIVPAMWLLGQNVRSRVFTDTTIPDLVEAIYKERLGGTGRTIRNDLTRSYPSHELLVQYRESDRAFIYRRLEQEGIFTYFVHDGDHEVLVLADSNANLAELGEPATWIRGAGVASGEGVLDAAHHEQVGSTDVVVARYDWTEPTSAAVAQRVDRARRRPPLEVYSHDEPVSLHGYDQGERRYREDDADVQARMLSERLDLARQRWELVTTLVAVRPGQVLELVDYPETSMNGRYVVVGVAANGSATEGSSGVYQNSLSVIPEDLPFRPARRAPTPAISGIELAVVVGPSGEEIHTDEHGRVRIRFPWDRENVASDPDQCSCWLRVVQPWAGPGFGVLFVPRIGMEVAVSFMGGDPDRPIIMGCIYNGDNRVPTPPLPDRKTQSVIRTKSSVQSDGWNELRFEDEAGREEIYIHAQRDMRQEILHDREVDVGNDERIHIHHDRRFEVDGRERVEVHGRRRKIQHAPEEQTFHSSLTTTHLGDHTTTQDFGTIYHERINGLHSTVYTAGDAEAWEHVVAYNTGLGVRTVLNETSGSVTEIHGTNPFQVWSPGNESFMTLSPTLGLVGIMATQKIGLRTTDESARVRITPGNVDVDCDQHRVAANAEVDLRVGDSSITISNGSISLRSGGSIITIAPTGISIMAAMVSAVCTTSFSVMGPVVTRLGKPTWD